VSFDKTDQIPGESLMAGPVDKVVMAGTALYLDFGSVSVWWLLVFLGDADRGEGCVSSIL
jgi:hypothetical protein